MAKPNTGKNIAVEVGTLANPDVRAVPVTLPKFIGTSAGIQVGTTDAPTLLEYGEAEAYWADGAVQSANWTMDLSGNLKDATTQGASADGQGVIENAVFNGLEIYTAVYPFGTAVGKRRFSGYASPSNGNYGMPRDGNLDFSTTLNGRGALARGTA